MPRLTRVQSGLIQLTPAPLAMIGGLILLGEPITARVIAASTLILGGVALGTRRGKPADECVPHDMPSQHVVP